MRLLAAVVMSAILAQPVGVEPVRADTPSFKRVKPLAPTGRNLINIQVEPVAPVERVLSHVPDIPAAVPKPAIVKVPQTGTLATPTTKTGWFWAQMSPSLAAANPSRMLSAYQVVLQHAGQPAARAIGETRLEELSRLYGARIEKATAGTRVSPALVLAVMAVESAGKPKARSHAGAVGLMQLMPATAKRFGVTDRTSPVQSIRGGVAYLDFLLGEFGGDPLLALAAYNAGEGAVAKAGGVPDYSETRAYVPKVIAAWGKTRQLCVTPPNRAGDRCIFRGVQIASQ